MRYSSLSHPIRCQIVSLESLPTVKFHLNLIRFCFVKKAHRINPRDISHWNLKIICKALYSCQCARTLTWKTGTEKLFPSQGFVGSFTIQYYTHNGGVCTMSCGMLNFSSQFQLEKILSSFQIWNLCKLFSENKNNKDLFEFSL